MDTNTTPTRIKDPHTGCSKSSLVWELTDQHYQVTHSRYKTMGEYLVAAFVPDNESFVPCIVSSYLSSNSGGLSVDIGVFGENGIKDEITWTSVGEGIFDGFQPRIAASYMENAAFVVITFTKRVKVNPVLTGQKVFYSIGILGNNGYTLSLTEPMSIMEVRSQDIACFEDMIVMAYAMPHRSNVALTVGYINLEEGTPSVVLSDKGAIDVGIDERYGHDVNYNPSVALGGEYCVVFYQVDTDIYYRIAEVIDGELVWSSKNILFVQGQDASVCFTNNYTEIVVMYYDIEKNETFIDIGSIVGDGESIRWTESNSMGRIRDRYSVTTSEMSLVLSCFNAEDNDLYYDLGFFKRS